MKAQELPQVEPSPWCWKDVRCLSLFIRCMWGLFWQFYVGRQLEPDADAFCERAKDQDLLIVSATGFGCPGYARVSYCVDYDMIERSFLAFEKLYQSYR